MVGCCGPDRAVTALPTPGGARNLTAPGQPEQCARRPLDPPNPRGPADRPGTGLFVVVLSSVRTLVGADTRRCGARPGASWFTPRGARRRRCSFRAVAADAAS